MNIISYGLINGSILTVIIVSGLLAINGKVEIGYIYMFQSYMSQLFSPIEFILEYKTKKNGMSEILKRYNNYHSIKEVEYCHDKIDNIVFDNVELFDKKIKTSVSRGELLLIKGGNGSGKTTLLKKLMGFENHDNILINGSTKLYDDLVYISSNNLDNRFTKNYKESSTGEFRIKQIKQYVNLDRSLYIFDEPTNYVDFQNKKIIVELINKLLNNNKIVIIVTHDNLFDFIDNKINIML